MKLQQIMRDKFSTGPLPAMSFLILPLIAAAREKIAFISRHDSKREIYEMARKTVIRSSFIIWVLVCVGLGFLSFVTPVRAQFFHGYSVKNTTDTVIAGAEVRSANRNGAPSRDRRMTAQIRHAETRDFFLADQDRSRGELK